MGALSPLGRGYTLPIPFGWFAVSMSNELETGEVRTVRYFDREFVIWRGEDGKPRALDPYCSHMGAHLGFGGQVIGNDLRCPFHHWTYDGEGGVKDIPYAKFVPPRLRTACIPSWPIQETLGVLYVWFHPKRELPLWELATFPEIDEQGWVEAERHEWVIKVHMQEITENGMDYAHFGAIHGTKSPPVPEYTVDGYFRRSSITASMETPRGMVQAKIDINATGTGQSYTRFSGISDIVMAQQTTAIDQNTTHMRWQFYLPPNISEGRMRLTKAQMRDIVFQVGQDIPIWENKRYEPNPLLVDGDGPILSYRDQYAKYYAP
jgi:3-ketosteroid 9alpha-monooxygenase subunit A